MALLCTLYQTLLNSTFSTICLSPINPIRSTFANWIEITMYVILHKLKHTKIVLFYTFDEIFSSTVLEDATLNCILNNWFKLKGSESEHGKEKKNVNKGTKSSFFPLPLTLTPHTRARSQRKKGCLHILWNETNFSVEFSDFRNRLNRFLLPLIFCYFFVHFSHYTILGRFVYKSKEKHGPKTNFCCHQSLRSGF